MTLTVTMTLTMTTLTKSTSFQASNSDQLVILSTFVTAVTVSKSRSSTISMPPSTTSSPVASTTSLAVSYSSSAVQSLSTPLASQALASNSMSLKQIKGANSSWKLGLAIGIPGAIALMIGMAAVLLIVSKKRKFGKSEGTLPDHSYRNEDGASLSTYSCDDLEKNEGEFEIPERKPESSSATPVNTTNQPMTTMKSRLSRYFNWNDRITAQDPIISQVIKNTGQAPGGSCTPLTAILLKRFKLRSRLTGKSAAEVAPPLPDMTYGIPKHIPSEVERQNDQSRPQFKPSIAQEETLSPDVSQGISPGIKIETQYQVVRRYSLKLPDEMSIEVGDTVVVFEHFSDGWCKAGRGKHLGIVPLICLKKLES